MDMWKIIIREYGGHLLYSIVSICDKLVYEDGGLCKTHQVPADDNIQMICIGSLSPINTWFIISKGTVAICSSTRN